MYDYWGRATRHAAPAAPVLPLLVHRRVAADARRGGADPAPARRAALDRRRRGAIAARGDLRAAAVRPDRDPLPLLSLGHTPTGCILIVLACASRAGGLGARRPAAPASSPARSAGRSLIAAVLLVPLLMVALQRNDIRPRLLPKDGPEGGLPASPTPRLADPNAADGYPAGRGRAVAALRPRRRSSCSCCACGFPRRAPSLAWRSPWWRSTFQGRDGLQPGDPDRPRRAAADAGALRYLADRRAASASSACGNVPQNVISMRFGSRTRAAMTCRSSSATTGSGGARSRPSSPTSTSHPHQPLPPGAAPRRAAPAPLRLLGVTLGSRRRSSAGDAAGGLDTRGSRASTMGRTRQAFHGPTGRSRGRSWPAPSRRSIGGDAALDAVTSPSLDARVVGNRAPASRGNRAKPIFGRREPPAVIARGSSATSPTG